MGSHNPSVPIRTEHIELAAPQWRGQVSTLGGVNEGLHTAVRSSLGIRNTAEIVNVTDATTRAVKPNRLGACVVRGEPS